MDARKGVEDYASVSGLLLNAHHYAGTMVTVTTVTLTITMCCFDITCREQFVLSDVFKYTSNMYLCQLVVKL